MTKPLQKSYLLKETASFVRSYPVRNFTQTLWKSPLLGFASAADPLFARLKEWVRPSHATPQDLLPTARTVISYFLPFESRIQKENAQSGFYPSRSWAIAYIETNRLIRDLGEHQKKLLEAEGYRTVFTPATHNYDPNILFSDWSHRHVAYIAGLGRLGLHNWLITRKGCCGRLGTVVTEAFFKPSSRPTQEFCLALAGYACSFCQNRCIYGAFSKEGFDRYACNRQLLLNDSYFSDLETTDVCGKCGCGLPCSLTNPVGKRLLNKKRKRAV
jgi:epoxyqueuosine reductase QueG